MRASELVRIAVVMALLSAWGCGRNPERGEPLWTEAGHPGRRTVVEVGWHLLWEIGAGGEAILASPRHLTAASDSLVVWWDDYDHQVLAADLNGQLRWRFGAEGRGPDEFLEVGDLAVDARGDVLALDGDNGRILRLAPDGTRRSLVTLPEGYWRGLAPQPSGSIVVAGVDGRRPFALIDSTGSVRQSFGAPWRGFDDLPLIQRQGMVISAPEGRWTYAFLVGNGWFPFRGTEGLGYLGQNVEHTDFPETVVVQTRSRRVAKLVSRPNCATCSGWIRGDTLNVLFGGYGDHANGVVDQYSWADGKYLRSIALPTPVRDAIVVEDLLVVISGAMEPTVAAYSIGPEPVAPTAADGRAGS